MLGLGLSVGMDLAQTLQATGSTAACRGILASWEGWILLEVQEQLRKHLLQLIDVHQGHVFCLGLPHPTDSRFHNEDPQQLCHKLQGIATDFGLFIPEVQVQQFAHQLLLTKGKMTQVGRGVASTGSSALARPPRGSEAGALTHAPTRREALAAWEGLTLPSSSRPVSLCTHRGSVADQAALPPLEAWVNRSARLATGTHRWHVRNKGSAPT